MRGLLGLGFLLAIGAIAVAVLSDDVRLLKFAALLGVWAALATAFPVVYFRRAARTAEQKTEESKRTYELELHREISARREYVIGVTAAAREDAETRHREELAGLREQLDRLNTTLSGLLDGDLLFERLTLSAESTRVRQVGGESGRSRLAAMARPSQIESTSEPTGPYVGQQSGPPVAVGPGAGSAFAASGAPYPVREDDTVQFARGTFGPVAQPPVRVPAAPAVIAAVEVAVESEVEPEAAVEAPAEPRPIVESEPEVAPAAEPEAVPVPVPEPELAAVAEPELELADPAAVAEPARFVASAAPQDTPPEHSDAGTGHSAGISVADLLAAYGASEGAPRRRRRAQD